MAAEPAGAHAVCGTANAAVTVGLVRRVSDVLCGGG